MKSPIFIALSLLISMNIYCQEVSDTTIIIKKMAFRVNTLEISQDMMLFHVYRDSILIIEDSLPSTDFPLKFIDFNKDKNTDLIFTYGGNNFTYLLYLFDAVNNTFKNVEGFDRFPQSLQLRSNHKYYYSYHREGCADFNWVSDLFTIVNFKSIHLAQIYGKGCIAEDEIQNRVIEVYKILNNNEDSNKLIEKLPYLKNIPEFADKWSFIEKYWNKNYYRFK